MIRFTVTIDSKQNPPGSDPRLEQVEIVITPEILAPTLLQHHAAKLVHDGILAATEVFGERHAQESTVTSSPMRHQS